VGKNGLGQHRRKGAALTGPTEFSYPLKDKGDETWKKGHEQPHLKKKKKRISGCPTQHQIRGGRRCWREQLKRWHGGSAKTDRIKRRDKKYALRGLGGMGNAASRIASVRGGQRLKGLKARSTAVISPRGIL